MKKIITLSILLMTTFIFAQEEEKTSKLDISGSIDAYYRTNLSTTDRGLEGTELLTSFADGRTFAVGMANVIFSYEMEKTGMVADLAFGPRAGQAISPGVGPLNQLYAYWNVSDNVTLTMGRFNTFLGYEVISPTGNFNYSTSHLFSAGPFSHVGLKADFTLSEDFTAMLAIINPTDVNDNLTGGYALGAQLGYSGQFLNLYYDDNEVLGFEIDYTGGFDISEDFYLGINAAYQTMTDEDDEDENSGFYGVALYPQFNLSDSFSLGARGEYFSNHSSIDNFEETSVLALTLTGSFSVENLTIKPEFRLDSLGGNDEEQFIEGGDDYARTNSLSTFMLAAIYSF